MPDRRKSLTARSYVVTSSAEKFHSLEPLLWGLVVSTVATAANWLLPERHAGEAVGLVFLLGTAVLALRRDAPHPPAHYGLEFAGLMSDASLEPRRMLSETLRAGAVAAGTALLILPPFAVGFLWWFSPSDSFLWSSAFRFQDSHPAWGFINLCLAHLLVVALPEEAFFRGYLQTSLDDRWPGRLRWKGWTLSWGIVASSALFALGHLATTPQLGRLAVFFPSLLFGLLRTRTGGVGASILLHATCNVFSTVLGKGFGL